MPFNLEYKIQCPENTITITKCEHSSLKHIALPDKINNIPVTNIFSRAFMYNDSLESLTLPCTLKSIDDGAFSMCTNLNSVVFPESLNYIAQDAFSFCSNLDNIVIPYGITKIERGTFYNCKNLSSIRFPNTLKAIGREAFFGCKKLKRITIPSSVQIIDASAFVGCEDLIIRCEPGSYAEEFATKIGIDSEHNVTLLHNLINTQQERSDLN